MFGSLLRKSVNTDKDNQKFYIRLRLHNYLEIIAFLFINIFLLKIILYCVIIIVEICFFNIKTDEKTGTTIYGKEERKNVIAFT